MKKILIIGQAPPAQKQEVPYDTTLLYEMFSWVGISKEQAQELFDFEAMTDKFPGFTKSKLHKHPPFEEMKDYYDRVLRNKILNADRVLVLGAVARSALFTLMNGEEKGKIWYELIHPSRRNYAKIMDDKLNIKIKLELLINPKNKP